MSHSCKDQLGILSDYLDGDLQPELCAEIERHLAECGNCRVVVDTLAKTVMLYRTYGHEEVPDDAKSRLYAVLEFERKRRDAPGSNEP
jgi:predicted anti-sigma-YlaC factor YlaD